MWTQGQAFGTIGAKRGEVIFEITTHRAEAYRSDSRKPTVTFSDDFQTNLGWTVTTTAADGPWERAVPIPLTTCDRGNPGTDGDGSGLCYVTDNSSANGCNSDVDNGSTTLTSPLLDAGADGEVYVSYWRWFSNIAGDSPNQDTFLVEVSGNGGASWTTLEVVGPVSQAGGGCSGQTLMSASRMVLAITAVMSGSGRSPPTWLSTIQSGENMLRATDRVGGSGARVRELGLARARS